MAGSGGGGGGGGSADGSDAGGRGRGRGRGGGGQANDGQHWFFEGDPPARKWVAFDAQMGLLLDEAAADGAGGQVQVKSRGWTYVLDLGTMTQTNAKTDKVIPAAAVKMSL
jgi:hypothetical protein